jgi:hypothetical protein
MRLHLTSATRIFTGIASALVASAAFAIPVKYQFSTGPAVTLLPGQPPPVVPADLAPLLGFGVTGTFIYDSDAAQTGTVTSPANLGAAIYGGAISQLSGTINGLSFFDMSGQATAGADTFVPGPLNADFLELGAPLTPPFSQPDFTGFVLGDFQLVNVRLFWIETFALPEVVADFLTASDLPAVLPEFHGRLALDFVRVSTGLPGSVQFRDQLRVRVPEPSTLGLAFAGLVVLLAARRRAPAVRS